MCTDSVPQRFCQQVHPLDTLPQLRGKAPGIYTSPKEGAEDRDFRAFGSELRPTRM
jgi:hypothetical protein